MKDNEIGRIEFGFGYLLENYPVHSDSFFELHYIYKGKGRLMIGEESIDLFDNLIYISPPFEKHFVDVQDELLFHIIRVIPAKNDIDLWFKFCVQCRKTKGFRLRVSKRYEIERIRELSGINNDNARKAAWYGLQSILHELFIPEDERRSISSDDKVVRIVRYMEQRIEDKITLDELASLVFLTPTQVSHIFKKETGIPPIEYFLRLKIDLACYFLSRNDFRNRELAEMLSFSDEFHFSKIFKAKIGISPSLFRKKEAEEKETFIENLLSGGSMDRIILNKAPHFHKK